MRIALRGACCMLRDRRGVGLQARGKRARIRSENSARERFTHTTAPGDVGGNRRATRAPADAGEGQARTRATHALASEDVAMLVTAGRGLMLRGCPAEAPIGSRELVLEPGPKATGWLVLVTPRTRRGISSPCGPVESHVRAYTFAISTIMRPRAFARHVCATDSYHKWQLDTILVSP